MRNDRSNSWHATTLVGFLASFILAGCGGSRNSQQSESSVTTPPPAMASPVAAYRHHHRHRHGHHGAGSVAAAGASGAGAGTVALGAGAAAAGAAPHAGATGSWPCNDTQFLQDQQQLASGSLQGDQEVDVCGSVTHVLPSRDTRSGLHGYYDLLLPSGATIEIVSDLGEMNAPAWPWVKPGDYSYVQGRYYYDSSGSQGIDWTHHGTSRSWPSAGYVVVNGVQYQ